MVLKKRRVSTYWGFPVADSPVTEKKNGTERKRGVAIIVAVMVIALMMVLTADMIVNSQVNMELVSAGRDNMVAEYMAKSGYNLALFLLSIDYGMDIFKQINMKQPPQDTLGDIWALMNGIPVGASTVEMLASMQETFALNEISDADVMERLKLFQGEFTLQVTDESAKINVNYCAAGAVTPACKQIQEMLGALFNCPIERSYLASKDVEPVEIIKKFQDWVDANDRADPQSGLNDESDPYANQQPAYKTKNSQFDTLTELKLIDQWDDDLHAVFSPYLTVYPFKKPGNDQKDRARININTVSRELLACLVPEARSECGETFDLAMVKAGKDKTQLGNNLQTALRDVLCLSPKGNKDSAKNKYNWFSESSPVYKIEIKGVAGFQEKNLSAVIKRGVTAAKDKTTTSYQLLFWQMS